MSRQLFVHIGPPKTASTSIQRMLRQAAPALAQAGVRAVHRQTTSLDGLLALMREEIGSGGANKFVYSDERFLGKRHEGDWPERIAEIAASVDAEVRVLAYVRPQCQMLESWHCQKTRNGALGDTFEQFMTDRLASGDLDYCTLFEPWRKRFGASSIRVTPLEPSRLGGDVRDHFLRLLGLEGGGLVNTEARANPRLGAKQLAIRQTVARVLIHNGIALRDRRRLMSQGLRHLGRLIRHDAPYAPLSPAQMDAVTERFADSNARFARRYGIDVAGRLFVSPLGDALTRPNRASWSSLGAGERMRARLYVRWRLGIRLPSA